MSTTQRTPAGWYPDPEHPRVTRYWNGSAWTKHHRQPPGVFVPKPPLTPEGQKRARRRERKIIGGIVAVVTLLGGLAMLGRAADTERNGHALALRACVTWEDALDRGGSATAFLSSLDAAIGDASNASLLDPYYDELQSALIGFQATIQMGVALEPTVRRVVAACNSL